MAEEEEVLMEMEAVQAVYGDNCIVVNQFPPHFHLDIKPRTADISSQQFVEAIIEIRASSQYPNELPEISIIESKGLDDGRQNQLLDSIQQKARELSSCLMLVALCEDAVEQLSFMNHPDGNCPLCLCPLVSDDEQNETRPFMKLMSCFHCFHSECILRWWNWLQKENKTNSDTPSATTLHSVRSRENKKDAIGENMGNCPVCRKVFHTKDFEHVLSLVEVHTSESSSNITELDEELLQSDSENIRRHKFEAILKLQQENSGLIEPKKNIVVLPGMHLPPPAPAPTQTLNDESNEEQQNNSTVSTGINIGDPSNRPSSSQYRKTGRRKQKIQNSRKQSVWVRKEDAASS
ncbi:uncharacterized protein LOC126686020 [Mercurialis annua]|uniref:uncharacterized protein LOC126686020 n=1 Tax=Mercurialis annua TaxID=3986 RepID=UPI00215FC714|nr:uncharacterized protein LOC126686020 [Mercurialis annua]